RIFASEWSRDGQGGTPVSAGVNSARWVPDQLARCRLDALDRVQGPALPPPGRPGGGGRAGGGRCARSRRVHPTQARHRGDPPTRGIRRPLGRRRASRFVPAASPCFRSIRPLRKGCVNCVHMYCTTCGRLGGGRVGAGRGGAGWGGAGGCGWWLVALAVAFRAGRSRRARRGLDGIERDDAGVSVGAAGRAGSGERGERRCVASSIECRAAVRRERIECRVMAGKRPISRHSVSRGPIRPSAAPPPPPTPAVARRSHRAGASRQPPRRRPERPAALGGRPPATPPRPPRPRPAPAGPAPRCPRATARLRGSAWRGRRARRGRR
ncbi:MAG: hypothetical protein QOC64_1832, partial [Solirubrobacteraceae bacterium]|nr:hypothetical protein [Solirubrobacteraceae bacterium]